MTLQRASLFVGASTLLGGIAGASIGSFLGRAVPGYYRNVFEKGNDPGFDPVAVGFGQGLTQGLAGGAAVGICLVAILAWHDVSVSKR